MEIREKSIEVLKKLYKELIDNDKPFLTINLDVKQFVTNNSMTKNELGRCLCYLNSAGYIKWNQPVRMSDEKEIVALTALAIDFVEQSN